LDINAVIQGVLFVSGAGGYLLVSQQNKYSIYGYWLGLLAQPCWLYMTLIGHQYAIAALVPFYTYGNIIGILKFHEK
jgi:hypothetical protein